MAELDGKVALITGGGGGVGRGIALSLARYGATVAINDLNRPVDGTTSAQKVADEITAAGGTAIASYGDITTFDSAETVVQDVVDRLGRIDILVLCAGNFIADFVEDLSEERWNQSLAVHMTGHLAPAKAAIARMRAQGDGGRIITVSSRVAFFGPIPAYAAAKAGVLGITSSLAAGTRQDGITVNCLVPSANTSLFPGDDPNARAMGGMPASQSLDAEDIAPLITFLAFPEAEAITGRYFYASGGDICLYSEPLAVRGGSNTFLRTEGRWDPRQLATLVPPLLGLGDGR